MTTVAEQPKAGFLFAPKARLDESGQSVLEFILMLPMMIGLSILMIRMNTAIQISIVDQQYARAQALFLTFNSSVYPQQKPFLLNDLVGQNSNQMIIGVSDNSLGSDANGNDSYSPKPTEQNITRHQKGRAPASPNVGPTAEVVRIFDTVSLCTQANVVSQNGSFVPVQPADSSSITNLPESTKFDYCRSPLQ